jgi:hypothetical protein
MRWSSDIGAVQFPEPLQLLHQKDYFLLLGHQKVYLQSLGQSQKQAQEYQRRQVQAQEYQMLGPGNQMLRSRPRKDLHLVVLDQKQRYFHRMDSQPVLGWHQKQTGRVLVRHRTLGLQRRTPGLEWHRTLELEMLRKLELEYRTRQMQESGLGLEYRTLQRQGFWLEFESHQMLGLEPEYRN